MTPETDTESEPNPPISPPLCILLALAIGICIYSFWFGFTLVRLWYYGGALGPEPEKFIIIPHHRKKKILQHPQAVTTSAAFHDKRATMFPAIAEVNKRATMFPHITDVNKPATALSSVGKRPTTNLFSDDHAIPDSHPKPIVIPTIHVEDVDEIDDSGVNKYEDFEDPIQVRKYVAEERRISRLPAFDQDDCGDGSEFPDIPFASAPVEARRTQGLESTKTYLDLGLSKVTHLSNWLTVDNKYFEMHEARVSILTKNRKDCIHVHTDGEAACEELLNQIVQHLCQKYSQSFSTKVRNRRNHVINDLMGEEYSIVRPFEHHPLELCARLAVEDFNIFSKNEFTQGWYL